MRCCQILESDKQQVTTHCVGEGGRHLGQNKVINILCDTNGAYMTVLLNQVDARRKRLLTLMTVRGGSVISVGLS